MLSVIEKRLVHRTSIKYTLISTESCRSRNIYLLLRISSMTELNQQIMIAISEIRFHDGTELQNNISGISVNQRKVGIVLEIPPNKIQESENIRREVEEAISKLDWVKQVTVAFTNKQISDADSKSKLLLDQVKKVILVLSGKGGVGKSTISALIADRLTSMGYKIGLLDADIQGPSIHRIFPTLEPIKIIDHKFLPALVRDVQIMSIGYLYDYALPWRGPMISKTLYKLLSLTAWQKTRLFDNRHPTWNERRPFIYLSELSDRRCRGRHFSTINI
jgi:ATP-binding protein involved in chromosome partitioning